MRRTALAAIILTLVIAPVLALADVTLPLGAREAFLHLDPTDTAEPARIVKLSDYGFSPGNTIRVSSVGDFDNGPGGDDYSVLLAVFSSSATLLDGSLLHRVPGAIDAGPESPTGLTCPSGEPTDIAEDFYVTHTGEEVVIPAGAVYLFIETGDCLFWDNTDPDGDFGVRIELVTAGVGEQGAEAASLAAPWPNPARDRMTLPFSLPRPAHARLAVYGVDGRLVRLLAAGALPSGRHEAAWDLTDEHGAPVKSGVYFAQLEVEGRQIARRIVKLR
jgi:hypothetical protein